MSNPLLMEGISDAVGFVGGALAGLWLGQFSASTSSPPATTTAHPRHPAGRPGGGAGLQLARAWRRRRHTEDGERGVRGTRQPVGTRHRAGAPVARP